jgi:hypothetical protein
VQSLQREKTALAPTKGRRIRKRGLISLKEAESLWEVGEIRKIVLPSAVKKRDNWSKWQAAVLSFSIQHPQEISLGNQEESRKKEQSDPYSGSV